MAIFNKLIKVEEIRKKSAAQAIQGVKEGDVLSLSIDLSRYSKKSFIEVSKYKGEGSLDDLRNFEYVGRTVTGRLIYLYSEDYTGSVARISSISKQYLPYGKLRSLSKEIIDERSHVYYPFPKISDSNVLELLKSVLSTDQFEHFRDNWSHETSELIENIIGDEVSFGEKRQLTDQEKTFIEEKYFQSIVDTLSLLEVDLKDLGIIQ